MGMPFDPNIPKLDKRALCICIAIVVALIVAMWLVHAYVMTTNPHPTLRTS